MKTIQTGMFFWHQNVKISQQQSHQISDILAQAIEKYPIEVMLDTHDEAMQQLVAQWVQTMSLSVWPLCLINNGKAVMANSALVPKTVQSIESLIDWITYQSGTITDAFNHEISVDELKLLMVHVAKPKLVTTMLGQSVINADNVDQREQDKLEADFLDVNWSVDEYVISDANSLLAGNFIWQQLQKIAGLDVPTDKAVKRDLLQFLLMNYQITWAKLSDHVIPVVYFPNADDAFMAFELPRQSDYVIQKWGDRKFEPVDSQQLINRLMQLAQFDGDVKHLQRLPITDDPDGSKRLLVHGQPQGDTTQQYYLDVMTQK